MKIAHLTSVHPRNDSRILVKECASLAAAGHEVSLVVADGKGGAFDLGVHIVDVGIRANHRLLRMTKSAFSFIKTIKSIQPDLIHIHDPELIPIALYFKKSGLKVVYDVHEDLPLQILAKYWIYPWLRPFVSKLLRRIEDYAALRFDAVVAANPIARLRFEQVGARTIGVCNYPIPGELMKDVEWNTRGNMICYVGSLSQNRGIKTLIEALPATEARLNLVGAWVEQGFREKLLNLPGWRQTIEHGFLGRTSIAQVLSESRVGIVTLHRTPAYLEALPVKLFEYMDAGIPVVISDFPIWREIVEDAQCGILVNPEDPMAIAAAVNQLMNDDELARKFGENGKMAVRHKYSWAREAAKLINLINELSKSENHPATSK